MLRLVTFERPIPTVFFCGFHLFPCPVTPAMRIPSNFSDHNLYRQRRSLRRQSSQSMRRVVRLVLALGVVLVVMRQAADPGIYKPFFPAPPTALTGPPTSAGSAPANAAAGAAAPVTAASGSGPQQQAQGSADTLGSSQGMGPGAARSTAEERRLVARLDADGQQRLTKWLAHWRRVGWQAAGQDAGQAEDAGEDVAIRSEVDRAAAALEGLIAACESQVPPYDSPEAAVLLSAVDPLTLARLQDALDATYQQRVVDGTIWRGADADAFYRYLEIAAHEDFAAGFLQSDPPPRRVGVLPLMQQPTEYLGHAVWLYGNVARAVSVPAKENPFGIESYWEVWLRPDDGTERAVILYSPDVPPDVSAVGPDATLLKGPRVAIAGRFLKRRLFGAVGGATESPVIVGRIWPRTPLSSNGPAQPLDRPRFWTIVAVAGVVGLGLAGLLLWRTSVNAKHLRGVRAVAAKLPDSFEQIVDSPLHVVAPEGGGEQADRSPGRPADIRTHEP